MGIVSILIILTGKCYTFSNSDPFFSISVFVCLCYAFNLFFIVTTRYYINIFLRLRRRLTVIIRILRLLIVTLLLIAVRCGFCLFHLFFYISNRIGSFGCDILYFICIYVVVYRLRLYRCSVLICNLRNFISIFCSDLKVEFFSFFYFFHVLIFAVVSYICLIAVRSPCFDGSAVNIGFLDRDMIGLLLRCLLCRFCTWNRLGILI